MGEIGNNYLGDIGEEVIIKKKELGLKNWNRKCAKEKRKAKRILVKWKRGKKS